jgi:3-phenylpropionate/cinnamic acid dioxygenase small subunit
MSELQVEASPTARLAEVEAFLYREARLADESRYDEWEALWDDDAVYWVPRKDDADPERDVSYIYDNRGRIRSRMAQLKTGRRHSQNPPSKMRRQVTNVEIVSDDGDELSVVANFSLFEHRHATTVWAGQYRFVLRRTDSGLKLVRKTVLLVNNGDAVGTIAFII